MHTASKAKKSPTLYLQGGQARTLAILPAVAEDRDGTYQTQPRQTQPIRTTQNIIIWFLYVTMTTVLFFLTQTNLY